MLTSIYIDNYALIEQLEIKLKYGLTIITGETGAGKTILLGALGLLLGKRADSGILKDKQKKCIIEGEFNLEGYGLEPFFESNDLDYATDTIIRREISNNGKSRAFINDTPVTLDIIQELTLNLIDIHSQHQSLSLNKDNYLLWIIDAYANSADLLKEYKAGYSALKHLEYQFNTARETFLKDKRDIDYLTHQFDELQNAGLKAEELGELEEKAMLFDHAEEIKSSFEQTVHLFSGEQTGAIVELKQAIDLLARIVRHFPPAEELRSRTEISYIELKDICAEVEQHFARVEFDPDAAQRINERIDLLHTLLHKNKVQSVQELIDIRDGLDQKLRQLTAGDSELDKMKVELDQLNEKVNLKAEKLSEKRNKVFPEFEQRITRLIRQLGMHNARFSIVHETTPLSGSGKDKIQFHFSANSSISPMNIARVASGGELSRLMLAIKYLISHASGLPTIIFDEIDSGVSGEVADKVGRLIMEMASGMQVINITHLPQVASKGNQHFKVYKTTTEGTTKTLIRELNKNERLHEVARMLSGDSVTEAAIENARVLLNQ